MEVCVVDRQQLTDLSLRTFPCLSKNTRSSEHDRSGLANSDDLIVGYTSHNPST